MDRYNELSRQRDRLDRLVAASNTRLNRLLSGPQSPAAMVEYGQESVVLHLLAAEAKAVEAELERLDEPF